MSERVTYQLSDRVAAITMDDGKVNVMSSAMQADLHAALDQAEADHAVVLLNGRLGVFSGGFDLPVLRAGGPPALAMVKGGFELAHRLLAFPQPVIVACTGHAIAMGCFLLCASDYRVGAAGSFRFTANEVAIGLTVPWSGIEILRGRLTPSALTRAVSLAEPFSPDNAIEVGFLDRVVPPAELADTARAIATNVAALDLAAHHQTKLRVREAQLINLRSAIDRDYPTD